MKKIILCLLLSLGMATANVNYVCALTSYTKEPTAEEDNFEEDGNLSLKIKIFLGGFTCGLGYTLVKFFSNKISNGWSCKIDDFPEVLCTKKDEYGTSYRRLGGKIHTSNGNFYRDWPGKWWWWRHDDYTSAITGEKRYVDDSVFKHPENYCQDFDERERLEDKKVKDFCHKKHGDNLQKRTHCKHIFEGKRSMLNRNPKFQRCKDRRNHK